MAKDKGIVNGLPRGIILHGKTYDYEIIKVLGQGSFGITYLAAVKMRGELGTIDATVYVAIKEFFMHEINGRDNTCVTCGSKEGIYDKYKKKFIGEAKNLGKLKHENIIKVVEAFEENNTVYYSMEFISGGSLDDYILQKGRLTEQETLEYASQIADALSFMHSKNMLHLDLKPSNVMLRKNGEIVLIDFGLSKQYDENGIPESSTTIGSGTPGYAPIEQANYHKGKEFPVTMDIYALGATMYKMLTGVRPPEASAILNDGFPYDELNKKGVNHILVTYIEKAMEPTKKKRYQSVKEFVGHFSDSQNEDTIYDNVDEIQKCRNDKKRYANPKTINVPKQPVSNNASHGFSKWAWLISLAAPLIILLIWNISSNKEDRRDVIEMGEEVPFSLENSNASDLPQKNDKTIINGHEYVDLGLSVKWATCNIGADNIWDSGDYYAWGENEVKNTYWSKTYKYCSGSTESCTAIGNKEFFEGNSGHGYYDISASQYDVAYTKWGSSWRMPTIWETRELENKCKWKWEEVNGVKGATVIGPNGNSIFLPANGAKKGSKVEHEGQYGYYWSSTNFFNEYGYATYLGVSKNSREYDTQFFQNYRFHGYAIRPVTE